MPINYDLNPVSMLKGTIRSLAILIFNFSELRSSSSPRGGGTRAHAACVPWSTRMEPLISHTCHGFFLSRSQVLIRTVPRPYPADGARSARSVAECATPAPPAPCLLVSPLAKHADSARVPAPPRQRRIGAVDEHEPRGPRGSPLVPASSDQMPARVSAAAVHAQAAPWPRAAPRAAEPCAARAGRGAGGWRGGRVVRGGTQRAAAWSSAWEWDGERRGMTVRASGHGIGPHGQGRRQGPGLP
jgi:hypothetical protein